MERMLNYVLEVAKGPWMTGYVVPIVTSVYLGFLVARLTQFDDLRVQAATSFERMRAKAAAVSERVPAGDWLRFTPSISSELEAIAALMRARGHDQAADQLASLNSRIIQHLLDIQQDLRMEKHYRGEPLSTDVLTRISMACDLDVDLGLTIRSKVVGYLFSNRHQFEEIAANIPPSPLTITFGRRAALRWQSVNGSSPRDTRPTI